MKKTQVAYYINPETNKQDSVKLPNWLVAGANPPKNRGKKFRGAKQKTESK